MPLPSRKFSLASVSRRTVWLAAGGLLVCVLTVTPAHSQLGLDIAAIVAGLAEVNSTLQSALGGPLQALQSMQQQEQQFQQQVLYPMQAIQQAQQLAGSSLGTAQQLQTILTSPRSSAQMASGQQLEQAMLSANPNQVGQISGMYTQVYGALPSTSALPQQTINMIDMNDAQAQDALKKAIQLDALAQREMEVSQSLLSQIQSAPPGTVPLLTAQAAAWVLQGNAYSQSGMAELLRTRSASLAGTGARYKTSANATQNVNGVVQNLFGAGTPGNSTQPASSQSH